MNTGKQIDALNLWTAVNLDGAPQARVKNSPTHQQQTRGQQTRIYLSAVSPEQTPEQAKEGIDEILNDIHEAKEEEVGGTKTNGYSIRHTHQCCRCKKHGLKT